MKILTYKEALDRAENKDWFKGFYKESEICSDDEVKQINDLADKFKENPLAEYFEMDEDIMLQKAYFEDVIADLTDYLEEENN